MDEIWKRIVVKMTSGRFLSTVLIIGTHCVVVVCLSVAAVLGKIDVDVFLGAFAGFATLSGAIVTFYFTKEK